MQTAISALPRMGIEVLFILSFVATVSYLSFDKESPIEIIGLLRVSLCGFQVNAWPK